MHVLPKGFPRIRHYGLLANGNRAEGIARALAFLAMAPRGATVGCGDLRDGRAATAARLLSALRRSDDRHVHLRAQAV